ncbi:MAG: hydrogenase expression/formation protein HypE, partial [Bacillota bacterium]|nr:hydrogenase expression/formation protein HypE [Bacillota bacterium]
MAREYVKEGSKVLKINSSHGGGGKAMNRLIKDVFQKHFSNEILNLMEDSAVFGVPSCKLAFTTDSFVVNPLFFPGGDIGKMAVCGTVNDLLMRGATPKYLSAGFILEDGLEIDTLERIAQSMQNAAAEANVSIVAGDTKVIEGSGGVYINTSGIGILETPLEISSHNALPGDAVIVSGNLGNHHACILSRRMGIENSIKSDCAPLREMVLNMLNGGINIHAMRDITRGGLATVLYEIAEASAAGIEIPGGLSFADTEVQGFCEILGLDPLTMGNEGKLVAVVPAEEAEKAVKIMKASKYGGDAQIIGKVCVSHRPVV